MKTFKFPAAKLEGMNLESLRAAGAVVESTETTVTIDVDNEVWRKERPAFLKSRQQRPSGRSPAAGARQNRCAKWKAQAAAAIWGELHRHTLLPDAIDPGREAVWLTKFALRIGCAECLFEWVRLLDANPPDFSSRDGYFAWSVLVHNLVNRKLGKPEMAVEEARARWEAPD